MVRQRIANPLFPGSNPGGAFLRFFLLQPILTVFKAFNRNGIGRTAFESGSAAENSLPFDVTAAAMTASFGFDELVGSRFTCSVLRSQHRENSFTGKW